MNFIIFGLILLQVVTSVFLSFIPAMTGNAKFGKNIGRRDKDKGNAGTAAYLNVSASIFYVLKDLKKDDYNVEGLPETSAELIEEVIHDKEAQFSSPNLNVAYKMGVREYYKRTPYATALEENWGKAPGNLNSDGENLLVYGKQYGNVFIGVQPTFGYEGDPMRLLFYKSASLRHGEIDDEMRITTRLLQEIQENLRDLNAIVTLSHNDLNGEIFWYLMLLSEPYDILEG